MITSLIFAFTGYALLAVVSILDKFILTGSVKKSSVYSFYSTIFFLGAFLLVPLYGSIGFSDMIWVLGSGFAYGFALWTMFIALKYGEASHILPFVGGVVAIATYGLSALILGEVLSGYAQIGLIFLVGACLLLSFEKSKEHNGFHVGFLWAILSGILFGVSHVFAKYIYDIYPFVTGLLWTKGAVGFVGLIILCIPDVRKELFGKRKDLNSKSEKSSVPLVVTNKILGVIAVIAVQYAIAIGSVTIVNALAGIQYVLMFLFIYLLTRLKPKVFSEYFTKRELQVEVLALLFTVVGLMFLK